MYYHGCKAYNLYAVNTNPMLRNQYTLFSGLRNILYFLPRINEKTSRPYVFMLKLIQAMFISKSNRKVV